MDGSIPLWPAFVFVCGALVSLVIWVFLGLKSQVLDLAKQISTNGNALGATIQQDTAAIRSSLSSIERDVRDRLATLDRRVAVLEAREEYIVKKT